MRNWRLDALYAAVAQELLYETCALDAVRELFLALAQRDTASALGPATVPSAETAERTAVAAVAERVHQFPAAYPPRSLRWLDSICAEFAGGAGDGCSSPPQPAAGRCAMVEAVVRAYERTIVDPTAALDAAREALAAVPDAPLLRLDASPVAVAADLYEAAYARLVRPVSRMLFGAPPFAPSPSASPVVRRLCFRAAGAAAVAAAEERASAVAVRANLFHRSAAAATGHVGSDMRDGARQSPQRDPLALVDVGRRKRIYADLVGAGSAARQLLALELATVACNAPPRFYARLMVALGLVLHAAAVEAAAGVLECSELDGICRQMPNADSQPPAPFLPLWVHAVALFDAPCSFARIRWPNGDATDP